MEDFSLRDFIVEVVNKLFIYTDMQQWNKLQAEVFTENVLFDMSPIGGDNATKSSKEICEAWRQGFIGIDAVNHLAGNYLIDIQENEANVFAYATATHYKKAAAKGTTREFTGTYDLHLKAIEGKWKIDAFKYNLKYASGNIDLV